MRHSNSGNPNPFPYMPRLTTKVLGAGKYIYQAFAEADIIVLICIFLNIFSIPGSYFRPHSTSVVTQTVPSSFLLIYKVVCSLSHAYLLLYSVYCTVYRIRIVLSPVRLNRSRCISPSDILIVFIVLIARVTLFTRVGYDSSYRPAPLSFIRARRHQIVCMV